MNAASELARGDAELAAHGMYSAALERPGVHDIAVSREGYTSVTIEDVEVTAGPCNVVTKPVT